MAYNMARALILIACLALVLSGCNDSSSESDERHRLTNEVTPDLNEDSPDIEPSLFIQQSIEGLRLQKAAHASTWRLGEETNWSADLETGRIAFTFADGTIAEADLQIIGTYNTENGTFLWSWDHPSVEEPLQAHAQLAKEFGEIHGLTQYTERIIECTQDDAWTFTAVAARLANANGAYRGPAGTALIYMTFGEIKIVKP